MFTGIITHTGTIEAAENTGDLRVTVSGAAWAKPLFLGESIAVSGACMTVIDFKGSTFVTEVSAESVRCTAPGMWDKGKRVNLERAMALGDTLDGHIVTGHVDGVAKLVEISKEGDSHVLCFEAPAELSRYIAAKGSATVTGISLTVNKVDKNRFWVNIIPHTWANTILSGLKTGDGVNLEIDLIARYVERLLQK